MKARIMQRFLQGVREHRGHRKLCKRERELRGTKTIIQLTKPVEEVAAAQGLPTGGGQEGFRRMDRGALAVSCNMHVSMEGLMSQGEQSPTMGGQLG